MPEWLYISFGLRLGTIVFGAVETVLLVVAIATALVCTYELFRLSSRDRLQQRIEALRGTIVNRSDSRRAPHIAWYNRLGAVIAHSPLVGASEQSRLAAKLASAGIGGPGRVATLIACRFFFAILAAALVWFALSTIEFSAETGVIRYSALAFGVIVGWRIPDLIVSRLARRIFSGNSTLASGGCASYGVATLTSSTVALTQ